MQIEELGRELPALFGALLLSILFTQSGLDKLLDWRGNLEWLTGHFAKTFLAGFVPLLLATLTVLELATGIVSALGVIYFLFTGSTWVIFAASVIGATAITALFFGQRIAKDYPGAAVLIPYFLLVAMVMYFTNPFVRV